MPLIYVNYPKGTFNDSALDALAEQLTEDGLQCEKLPDTAFVKSTIRIYFNEYAENKVYHGGKSSGTQVISFEINVFEGGLSVEAKKELIKRVTDAVRKHCGLKEEDVAPVYVIIRDIPEAGWGVFGDSITLDNLRNPRSDAKPI